MTTNRLVFVWAAILSINCAIGSDIGVPVLLWQKRTPELDLEKSLDSSRSTVTQIDANVLADDYIGKTETVVAFVQKKLSLEQFTTADEDRLTAVKDIFNDHTIKPTLLVDVLNPVNALTTDRFRIEQWNQISVKNGDKVTIELPNDSLVNNNELLAQLIADIQKNVSKNTLFLLTGRQNQYRSIDLQPENDIPRERVRRAAEEPKEDQTDDVTGTDKDPNLVTVEGSEGPCLYFYTTEILVSHYNLSTGPQTLAKFYNFTQDTGKRVVNPDSHCWEVRNVTDPGFKWVQDEPAFLSMQFTDINGTQLSLEMTILSPYASNKTGFWFINTTLVNLTFASGSESAGKGGEYKLLHNQSLAGADIGFGYSCGQQIFLSEKRSDAKEGDFAQISIRFSRLQLQPFLDPHNRHKDQPKYIFTESFDCEVWFTLPLWMGLLTLLVLFVILFVGVYFVSAINTPDRFENPKSKPLVIANVDE